MKIKLKIESLGDDGYHIFCKVRVNGIECRALIDTGASKTVLSSQLASQLELDTFINPDDHQMTGIQPGNMDVAFAVVDTIQFGKLKFENIVSGLLDLTHVHEQYKLLKLKPFMLIIGGDILKTGQAKIDYKNLILEFDKP